MTALDEVASAYAAAAYAKDDAAMLAFYAPNVLLFDMWETWSYEGREAWAGVVKNWFGSLGSERVKVSFKPIFQKQIGDCAVWCATVRFAGESAEGQELRSLEERLTWTLQRIDGRWLIMHQHSSAPASFETQKVRLSSKS